ncbi:MAG TPA: GDSL-type esterase/lipase family protein [Methylomirabilota bacterium]|jgi:acyl-CoA thioesterase-1|nr:GDSL-type esterase/lipase family protein [Methylomirabilota bacterium]
MLPRRRALLLGAVVLVAAAAWVLWTQAPRRSPGPAGSSTAPVVFLGDSITSGHRLSPSVAFPHRLGEALGVRVVNAGISGDTTEGGLLRLDRDVLAHRPRVVVVELGVNDVFGRWPQERTVENLRTITQRVRTQGAAVVLLHIRLPGLAGDGYRRPLREIARGEGAILVEDFLDGVVPDRTYDGLHPDEEGQAILAERLLPVLRQALGRS